MQVQGAGGKVQGAGGRMPDARCQVQQGRCPPIQILGKRNSDEHPFARSASPGQATGGGWKWVSECHGFRRYWMMEWLAGTSE
ncbi:hypothetical protein FOVG_10588 [Fusarium oxysporum f. sp. pisi HDV247]|uniref:Uncharacterized protein n=1 Tax=Fusarium oxysporum f. sp. pisi HDV247 TaxID=1080344 RepID=W9P0W9_FUSOX|nr:hypothetical protein FOVG_10588 [Fusarium oxysporum f. sp. pisi HDV247]